MNNTLHLSHPVKSSDFAFLAVETACYMVGPSSLTPQSGRGRSLLQRLAIASYTLLGVNARDIPQFLPICPRPRWSNFARQRSRLKFPCDFRLFPSSRVLWAELHFFNTFIFYKQCRKVQDTRVSSPYNSATKLLPSLSLLI